jgi:RNA polymerase sigma-70 factor (ECF subfamily)
MEAQERVPRGVSKLVESFLSCKPLLSRVVGRIVRPNEIEDIVQETFVLSYAAARNQDIANPRAFMLRTARNIALDHIGSAGRRLNCSLEDLGDEAFMSQVSTIEAEVQSDERFLAFCRAVAELPVGCRRVFILKKVYGLSQKEIASYLGLSPRTVEKHVARGMFMTARYMQAKGLAHGAMDPDLRDRDEVETR